MQLYTYNRQRSVDGGTADDIRSVTHISTTIQHRRRQDT